MYKFRNNKSIKRSPNALLWWVIICLGLGELVMLAMILNQGRVLNATINSVSSQFEEFRRADPLVGVNEQVGRIDYTVGGLLDIMASMKLTDDQMEKLNRLYPASVGTSAAVPTQPEASQTPASN